MAEMLTEQLTDELPRELYIILYRDTERYGRIVPLWVPFGEGNFGFPVFSDREGAREFVASPNCDIPVAIHRITLEQFIRAGENPIAVAQEHGEGDYFYMVDPRPIEEWGCVENMGAVIPMADAAKMLREELGAG